MKKISTFLCAASLGISSISFAQQDPQFTQFFNIKQVYNPAYVGTKGTICFDGVFRQQWVSFPGAPKTGVFAFNMPVGNFGVGLTIMNDQIGNQSQFTAKLAAAYHIHIGATGILSIGIDAGIYQTKINGTYIAPQTLQDPTIPNNSATSSQNINKMIPDFDGGVYYTIPNKLYVGISSSHLGAQTIDGSSAPGTVTPFSVGYKLQFDLARHYYVMAGYTFNASADIDIMPNVLVKTDGASTQLDLNVIGMFKKTIGLGVSYRLQDAIAPMLIYQSNFGLRFGYSYDVTTSKIKGYSSGTHEISIGYCFKPKAPAKVQSHWNTRYFSE